MYVTRDTLELRFWASLVEKKSGLFLTFFYFRCLVKFSAPTDQEIRLGSKNSPCLWAPCRHHHQENQEQQQLADQLACSKQLRSCCSAPAQIYFSLVYFACFQPTLAPGSVRVMPLLLFALIGPVNRCHPRLRRTPHFIPVINVSPVRRDRQREEVFDLCLWAPGGLNKRASVAPLIKSGFKERRLTSGGKTAISVCH